MRGGLKYLEKSGSLIAYSLRVFSTGMQYRRYWIHYTESAGKRGKTLYESWYTTERHGRKGVGGGGVGEECAFCAGFIRETKNRLRFVSTIDRKKTEQRKSRGTVVPQIS